MQAKAEKKALREVMVYKHIIMVRLQQEESLREDKQRCEAECEESRKAQEEKSKTRRVKSE